MRTLMWESRALLPVAMMVSVEQFFFCLLMKSAVLIAGGQLLVVSGSRILCLENEQWTCKASLPAPLTGSAAAMAPSPSVAFPS